MAGGPILLRTGHGGSRLFPVHAGLRAGQCRRRAFPAVALRERARPGRHPGPHARRQPAAGGAGDAPVRRRPGAGGPAQPGNGLHGSRPAGPGPGRRHRRPRDPRPGAAGLARFPAPHPARLGHPARPAADRAAGHLRARRARGRGARTAPDRPAPVGGRRRRDPVGHARRLRRRPDAAAARGQGPRPAGQRRAGAAEPDPAAGPVPAAAPPSGPAPARTAHRLPAAGPGTLRRPHRLSGQGRARPGGAGFQRRHPAGPRPAGQDARGSGGPAAGRHHLPGPGLELHRGDLPGRERALHLRQQQDGRDLRLRAARDGRRHDAADHRGAARALPDGRIDQGQPEPAGRHAALRAPWPPQGRFGDRHRGVQLDRAGGRAGLGHRHRAGHHRAQAGRVLGPARRHRLREQQRGHRHHRFGRGGHRRQSGLFADDGLLARRDRRRAAAAAAAGPPQPRFLRRDVACHQHPGTLGRRILEPAQVGRGLCRARGHGHGLEPRRLGQLPGGDAQRRDAEKADRGADLEPGAPRSPDRPAEPPVFQRAPAGRRPVGGPVGPAPGAAVPGSGPVQGDQRFHGARDGRPAAGRGRPAPAVLRAARDQLRGAPGRRRIRRHPERHRGQGADRRAVPRHPRPHHRALPPGRRSAANLGQPGGGRCIRRTPRMPSP